MRGVKGPSENSQNTRKIRKILNEEIRLGINADSDSETEEVNLKQELFPLSHYINNREEMIEQMFSIMKGPKLKNMLPLILRDMPLEQLKADCLIHLLGMSKKRIRAIMEGREIDSTSDSESHSDSPVSPNKKAKMVFKPLVVKQEGCSDISDNSEEVVLIDPDQEDLIKSSQRNSSKEASEGKRSKKYQISKKRKKHLDGKKKPIIRTVEENPRGKSESGESEESSSGKEDISEIEKPTEGKTLLEILELEMRARAIRALLHKGGTVVTESNDNSVENTRKTATEGDKCTKGSESQSGSDKITPKRNFRKKKKKNDDVIVITPKVVTIDLTDEHDHTIEKSKDNNLEGDSLKLDELFINLEESQHKDKPSKVDSIVEENANIVVVEDKKNNEEHTSNIHPSSSVVSSMDNSTKSSSETLGKEEQGKNSWALRWLDSKEVKKVVSTSKICGNVRKKIKRSQLAKKNQESSPQLITNTPEIEGTVNEFQSLPKSIKVLDPNANNMLHNETPVNTITELTVDIGSNEQTEKSSWTSCSIDQVQDVTSTKNESSLESNIHGPTVCDVQENEYNITDDNSSYSKSISVVQDTLNTYVCEVTTPNIKAIHSTNTNVEVHEAIMGSTLDTKSLETCEKETNDNQSNPDNEIRTCIDQSPLSVPEENLKRDIFKLDLTHIENTELLKIESESNQTCETTSNNQECVNNQKSQTLEFGESRVNSSSEILTAGKGDFSSKCRAKTDENEPETLEISINDEDEIDEFD